MTPARRVAFSLPETLFVVAIVAILLAILLPVVGRVRAASRSTACLANLQQWGQSYQMYVGANSGRSPATHNGNDALPLTWWVALEPYNGDVAASLLCPDGAGQGRARNDPGSRYVLAGTSHGAWQVNIGEGFRGSYGFNYWLAPPWPGDSGHFHSPVAEANRVPVLGDCCDFQSMVPGGTGDNQVPTNLDVPNSTNHDGGITEYCIDRHQMAINMVFVDGHAERVPLAELWKLKWSESYRPRSVVVPRS